MSPQTTPGLHVDVGGTTTLEFKLAVAGTKETVTVSGEPPLVEGQPSGLSSLIDERAINELPLNGRRYTDLALLTPGVTQDPRGLTSGSNGDLAPNPLVSCPVTSTNCQLPTGLAQLEPADVSAFSHNFKTPRVQQASLNIEREVAHRTSVGVSYM
jgi:hypothetical protein